MQKDAFAERAEPQRGAGSRAKAPLDPPTALDAWKVHVKALRPVWI